MKKILALSLLLSIALCFLVGCTIVDDVLNVFTPGENKFYSVEVMGDKTTLMKPIMPTYRAGTTVEIKAHSVTDVSLHVFVNGVEIPMSHYDSDYWGFEFVMPKENITIHLTFDQFYGKEEYDFDELFSGYSRIEHFESAITKVSTRTTDYSEKYSFIETKYSYKQEDIDAFKAIFNEKLIKADNNVASQATYGNEYVFYYNVEYGDEMYESLEFNDEFYTWNDFSSWQAFKFKDEDYTLPTIENPDFVTYSFRYDGRSSYVKSYDDDSLSIKYFNIGDVEFIPYEGNDSFTANSPYYLDSGYGKIHLLSSTIFELNGEYYEIVSGTEYWAFDYCELEFEETMFPPEAYTNLEF